ncbi:MAG TPA: hypothetical protein VFX25_39105 [Streptosporangiaceae bacterium]|nr:hypothetical protein [Streptosporangiaceae bacterium]
MGRGHRPRHGLRPADHPHRPGSGLTVSPGRRAGQSPLLPETFVLKIPATLPCGGTSRGPGEFDRFFASIIDNQDYWATFRTELADGSFARAQLCADTAAASNVGK